MGCALAPITLPHKAEIAACVQAVKTFHETGSHYLAHADFGCPDGIHSAWIVSEAENHAEARLIVPPPLRANAKVIHVTHYTMSDLDDMLPDHEGTIRPSGRGHGYRKGGDDPTYPAFDDQDVAAPPR